MANISIRILWWKMTLRQKCNDSHNINEYQAKDKRKKTTFNKIL